MKGMEQRCHRIKICGLMTTEDARVVNEAKADFAGMVFADTRRKVSRQRAEEIRKTLDEKIPAVGVFVNEDPEVIRELAEHGIINMIQLHGDEPPERIIYLKETTGLPVIKAFRIRDRDDLASIRTFPADYFLFDTYVEGSYGGTGQTFDWTCLQDVDRPYFLAGGLRMDNIADAMRTPAYALDISSGVETSGRKDREKILAVTKRVHAK